MRNLFIIILILVTIFSGCKNPPKPKTLGDEMVERFGSYENAMKQHILIIPWWLGKEWDHTIREVAPQNVPHVINTLKKCICCKSPTKLPELGRDSPSVVSDGIILIIGSGKLPEEEVERTPHLDLVFGSHFLLEEYIYKSPSDCRSVQHLAKWLYQNSPPVPRFLDSSQGK